MNAKIISKPKRGRGRPKKQAVETLETRELLLRAGMAMLTQTGFMQSSIDPILKSVGVPKGSFYYYFSSKEVFGLAVLARYRRYFEAKLDGFLLDEAFLPLDRLERFALDAQDGMARHDFKRGCLVGNLEQESSLLSEAFQQALKETYQSWQSRVASCLREAEKQTLIAENSQIDRLSQAFWIGWEGAVHRSRLEKSGEALTVFIEFYLGAIRLN
ncbi:TetR family transcriptional regulator C-terminal domain-containing protein [Marinomonas algarum]|uniref:TetR/AcrR family transcriptional regulator n=1 Tax=Marinomonas algarum TaxID=2883105 RepID=A0A9X1INH5_9GAMM|nr:TetR family transcriptional regulator C-terminal domain-containing protein [Marinomonas algarum]MCB5162498.1 TetR/AcrR family transcriptional regulator [Marinomonas algarum]